MRELINLNLRNNMIEVVGDLSPLTKLKRVNLSNNMIQRKRDLYGAGRLPALLDLKLFGNPLVKKSDYFSTVVRASPSLRYLDLIQITPKMREDGKLTPEDEVLQEEAIKAYEDRNKLADYSTEGLLSLIYGQWKAELKRVSAIEVDKIERTIKHRCLVKNGFVEIDRTSLIIYGNALEILDNFTIRATIQSITFQYIHLTQIMHHDIIEKLKKFKMLKQFNFRYNNITLIKQIFEIDRLLHAMRYSPIMLQKDNQEINCGSILIKNNQICSRKDFRPWMIYKFHGHHHILRINEELIDAEKYAQLLAIWNKENIFTGQYRNYG